jgi:hypothetical protein
VQPVHEFVGFTGYVLIVGVVEVEAGVLHIPVSTNRESSSLEQEQMKLGEQGDT